MLSMVSRSRRSVVRVTASAGVSEVISTAVTATAAVADGEGAGTGEGARALCCGRNTKGGAVVGSTGFARGGA